MPTRLLPILLAALIAACGDDDDPRAARAESPPGGRSPYRVASLVDPGRITGTLALPDTVAPADAAGETCGALPRRPTWARRVGARAVVWLGDVRVGKPLPVERRFALTSEQCELVPRVQSVTVGGTINVLSEDALEHDLRFISTATGRALAVVRQFDAGQLVPKTDLLLEPGTIEVRCDRHPWMRAWIHVFDHPYHSAVGVDGSFAIDSVPPGARRLVYWHERLGARERVVDVPAGETARLELGF